MKKILLLLLMTISTVFALDFPASPSDGDEFIRSGSVFRYKTSESTWYLAPPVTVKKTITQATHGLAVGDVIKVSGANTFAKAQADSEANGQVVGVVESVSGNDFTYVSFGKITLSSLTAGSVYYLSAGTAGASTATKPSTDGQYVVKLYTALNTTTGWVNISIPHYIGIGSITNLTASGTITAANIVATSKLQLGRVTTAARNALCSGASDQGVFVYDTTLNSTFYYNGSTWVEQ